jgi:hypothetical protein
MILVRFLCHASEVERYGDGHGSRSHMARLMVMRAMEAAITFHFRRVAGAVWKHQVPRWVAFSSRAPSLARSVATVYKGRGRRGFVFFLLAPCHSANALFSTFSTLHLIKFLVLDF